MTSISSIAITIILALTGSIRVSVIAVINGIAGRSRRMVLCVLNHTGFPQIKGTFLDFLE